MFVANDVRRRLAALGARTLDELRGRSDLLRRRVLADDRLAEVDLAEILRLPERPEGARRQATEPTHLDDLVARPWMVSRETWHATPELPITPIDRAVGARLSHDFATRRSTGAETGDVTVRYHGTAGQSFGAFLTSGITLDLAGDANDYVGKSTEGGRIVVRGFDHDRPEPVVGNACFYGARGGEGFIRGSAGERFAVRNSGARLVVEGAGDHACEYMTAGTVAILGPVGRNLASGMSGGTLFLLRDDAHPFAFGPHTCELRELDVRSPEAAVLHDLLDAHVAATGSTIASALLDTWPKALRRFVWLSQIRSLPTSELTNDRELVTATAPL